MAQKLRLWLPVLIWMVVIFAFSAMSINGQAKFSWPDFIIKKTAHVTEYAILFLLTYRANKSFKSSLIVCLLFALSDEWHQTLTPGREGRLRDVGFDTLGILSALTWLRSKV